MIRFLNGHIEIDYEPVAQILEGKDWKWVEVKITDWAAYVYGLAGWLPAHLNNYGPVPMASTSPLYGGVCW